MKSFAELEDSTPGTIKGVEKKQSILLIGYNFQICLNFCLIVFIYRHNTRRLRGKR